MEKYIVIGDSGHAKVITDCIASSGDSVIAYLDDKYNEIFYENEIVKGPVAQIHSFLKQDIKVVIAVGNNIIRKKIVDYLNIPNEKYGVIVHKSAIVSENALIENGTVIMPNCVINAGAKIGKQTIINTGSIIEHDCEIFDFAHISPGTVLTGGVVVEEGTQIGAKSVVIPLVNIGEWSMIGAGSTVINDIGDYVTAVGSPAKVIRKKEA
jgi:acetyltransferase EpsM